MNLRVTFLALAALALGSGCKGAGGSAKAADAATAVVPTVEVATAIDEEIERRVEVTGTLAASEEGVIGFEVEGTLTGILVDPHSAVGIAAGLARRRDPHVPMVYLATAHPAKFPDAIEAATGLRPAAPPRLAGLLKMPERMSRLPNDLKSVEAFVRAKVAERKKRTVP